VFGTLTATIEVVGNTGTMSSEMAALYHCFKRLRNGQGSPESLKLGSATDLIIRIPI
jgi:hypothetical protein